MFVLSSKISTNPLDIKNHIKNIIFDKDSDIDRIYNLVHQYIGLYSQDIIEKLTKEIDIIENKKIVTAIDLKYNRREITNKYGNIDNFIHKSSL